MLKETVTFACILATLLCLTSALNVTNCGSSGQMISINVAPCEPFLNGCKLVRGTNVSFTLVFRPHQEVAQLNHKVYGVIVGIPMPFGVGGLNACKNVGGCPLQPGSEHVYWNQFVIRSAYPSLSLKIKYILLSGTDQVICFLMDAMLA